MFNLVDGRVDIRFRNLVVVLVSFIFVFSSAVYSYQNGNREEYGTKMLKYNYLQYKPIAQVAFTNQNEINPYLINSTSIGCARMMEVSIKKNMDLSLQNTDNYFEQKSFSERLNLSNKNQNNSGTKGWKKTLIVTGEISSAMLCGHGAFALLSSSGEYISSYLIGEFTGSAAGLLLIGKLFHQDGSTKNTFVGSSIGTVIGFCGFFYFIGIGQNGEVNSNSLYISGSIALFSPSIGSVIGFNKK